MGVFDSCGPAAGAVAPLRPWVGEEVKSAIFWFTGQAARANRTRPMIKVDFKVPPGLCNRTRPQPFVWFATRQLFVPVGSAHERLTLTQ